MTKCVYGHTFLGWLSAIAAFCYLKHKLWKTCALGISEAVYPAASSALYALLLLESAAVTMLAGVIKFQPSTFKVTDVKGEALQPTTLQPTTYNLAICLKS